MEKITFEEQYNKIVNAYMKNELDPMKGCACFIGNLLDNQDDWTAGRIFDKKFLSNKIKFTIHPYNGAREIAEEFIKLHSDGMYSPKEIYKMEINFINKCFKNPKGRTLGLERIDPTEERLFKAMESTLLMLKKIHERNGEVIKPYNFKKRSDGQVKSVEALQESSMEI